MAQCFGLEKGFGEDLVGNEWRRVSWLTLFG